MIDSAQKVMLLAIDLRENLAEMPPPLRPLPHRLSSLLPNFRCKHWPETVPPMAHTFVANIDAAFVQKIFDISQ